MDDRTQIRLILDDVQTDALVTKQHADTLADEIAAALKARGLGLVDPDVHQGQFDSAIATANRWAYKYTMLANWLTRIHPDEVLEARTFVDEAVAASPFGPPTDKSRYTTPDVHPQYDMLPAADDDAITATLSRFGWATTPMFREKYQTDAWFHNVVNALVALSTEKR